LAVFCIIVDHIGNELTLNLASLLHEILRIKAIAQ